MASYTIYIPNTTFVSSAMPDSNFSSYPTIYTGSDQLYQTCIAYLQINLPTLPVNQIESAVLKYDQSIKFLDALQFPDGCDKNLITAYYNYLPSSMNVDIYTGSLVHETGMIYKNEYGILVLSDISANTSIFIPVFNINAVLPSTTAIDKAAKPQITAIKKFSENKGTLTS
jgi:hypothetical protein